MSWIWTKTSTKKLKLRALQNETHMRASILNIEHAYAGVNVTLDNSTLGEVVHARNRDGICTHSATSDVGKNGLGQRVVIQSIRYSLISWILRCGKAISILI